ncbi:hypothetical protein [Sphingobium yanoikuyae]|uniref:hypothetical protein n=1 Tax=Sphingobium yanoikuyae TaxID=13690 RepID=UPI0026F18F95|nr:hypothetical protein [Sphingobium yanoikuyae]
MTDITQELRGLIAKATIGNWKVVPNAGKPIIAMPGGGNLFQGYIATWQEADLIVAAINHLPALLDRLEAAEARFVDLEYRSAATESRLREWDAWFDRATADDDCEYLNGAGWSDATAIREVKP